MAFMVLARSFTRSFLDYMGGGAKFTGARRLRRGWFLAKFLSPQFSSANRTPGQLEVDKRPQSSKE